MTTETKKKIKRFIIRTEMWWYGATGIGYAATITLFVVTAPEVSNLTLGIIQLFTGFAATVAAAASAIKASDTEK